MLRSGIWRKRAARREGAVKRSLLIGQSKCGAPGRWLFFVSLFVCLVCCLLVYSLACLSQSRPPLQVCCGCLLFVFLSLSLSLSLGCKFYRPSGKQLMCLFVRCFSISVFFFFFIFVCGILKMAVC